MIDATIEMVDGVMVVSPKEVKFEPKDGDIVTYMNRDKATIYVFAGGYKYNTSFYVAYSGLRNEVFKTPKGHLDMNRDDIRPATEEEKKLLFDKIEAEGYEWLADERKLVKKKWIPNESEFFYRPSYSFAQFDSYLDEERSCVSESYINKGWIFRTEEECQKFCDKLNEAISSIKP